MNPIVSDETLYAFVDGEPDVAEREAFTARMQSDADLAQRVCVARTQRDMVRLAYAEPPVSGRQAAATTAPCPAVANEVGGIGVISSAGLRLIY